MAFKNSNYSYVPRHLSVESSVRSHLPMNIRGSGSGYAGSYDEAFGPPSPRALVGHFTADMDEPLIPDLIVDAWLYLYHDRGQGHG